MRLILIHRLSIQVVFVLLDFCAQHIEIRVVFVRINLELLPLHTQLNLLPLGQPRHLRITQIPGLVSCGTLTPRILHVHRHNFLIGLAHGRPQGLLEEVRGAKFKLVGVLPMVHGGARIEAAVWGLAAQGLQRLWFLIQNV